MQPRYVLLTSLTDHTFKWKFRPLNGFQNLPPSTRHWGSERHFDIVLSLPPVNFPFPSLTTNHQTHHEQAVSCHLPHQSGMVKLTSSRMKRARFQPPSSKLVPITLHPYPNPNPDRQLPNELIDVILEHLKTDDDLPAIAKVARTSRRMYSIAIPKLYETVTITQRNRYQFWYGHSEDGMPIYHAVYRTDETRHCSIRTTYSKRHCRFPHSQNCTGLRFSQGHNGQGFSLR
jgi:hypothetical protein